MALNPTNVATHVSEMIGIAVFATVKQHEIELGHSGRAVNGAAYPPSLAKDASRAMTDSMKAGLAATLSPLVPADAGDSVSNLICAGIQAAIAQHELDLAHPGRATGFELLEPPSACATAAQVAIATDKMTLVADLTTPDMVGAANEIMTMVNVGCQAAVGQHEIELAHPGREALGIVQSNVADAVTAAIASLVTQLIIDLGGTPP